MKLDPDKFTPDESNSNPMASAVTYPDCPMDKNCFYVAVGGAIFDRCIFF